MEDGSLEFEQKETKRTKVRFEVELLLFINQMNENPFVPDSEKIKLRIYQEVGPKC
jgi:hypothetical protein